MNIESESKLTLFEAASIIVGHGVGSGILAVPYIASRTSWPDIILIIAAAYAVNLLMHLMIAELSLNNGGKQFIKCFEVELFKGKMKRFFTGFAFAMLGLSVLLNVSGFISGSAAVFSSWFGWNTRVSMIVYYILAASVVFLGMKAVGIGEKIAVSAMTVVIATLFIATLKSPVSALPSKLVAGQNLLALYGGVSFSLSAVMSVPQAVKGLGGDVKKIRTSIIAGTGFNVLLLILVTAMTLLGAGSDISQNGALVDLSAHLGGWVSVIGYLFSLLALSTSLWANTLNLRDIVHEQINIGLKPSWVIASVPSLILALIGIQSFVGFTRLAGVIQVLTGIAIILAYNKSRKERNLQSPVCGLFGKLPFQIIVVTGSLLATVGSVLKVL
ncbi:MAG: aromatic amino acid transport family protein [Sphaerochaeta sp.]